MITNRRHSVARGVMLVFIPAISLAGEGGSVDSYALPRDKRPIEQCRQMALAAHPGNIQQLRERNTGQGFYYEFEIVDSNRALWLVTCDAATQTIVKSQSAE